MREIPLQAQSLPPSCIGKITWQKPWLKSNDYIVVAPQATKPCRAQLTLSAQPVAATTAGMAYIAQEQLESLQNGDVVLAHFSASMGGNDHVSQGAAPEQAEITTALEVTAPQALTNERQGLAHQGQQGLLVVLIAKGSSSNYLSLTDRCNHRCLMCPQPPVKTEASRLEQNLRLIALMSKDTASLGITGGEPTLVGDDLITILQAIKKRLPHTAITILTNAVKLADPAFVYKIANCRCNDLQVDVPLFASIPELHNEIVGAKTFYKTIHGIYNLATYGLDIGLRIVVHRLNYQHLMPLAYYIYHNFPFVKQVAFMQMETMGYAEDNIQRLWIDPFDYKDQLSAAANFLRQRGITTLIYNAQLCVINPDVREIAVQSISEWKNISLSECQQCAHVQECPGFFASNKRYHSAHIRALTI